MIALETKANKYDTLMKQLGSGSYKGSNLGNILMGVSASLVPQSGYSGLATIIPLVVGSVLANADIPVDINSLPGRDTIQKLVTEIRLIQ